MGTTENLYLNSLKTLEKYLQDDFRVLASDIQILSATKATNNTSHAVRQLIGLLQYQDVIGQKIQHIQKINELLEEEILQLNARGSIGKSISDLLVLIGKVNCFGSIIPDLLLLMMKLSRLALDEYTQVVKEIRAVLQQLNFHNCWNEENYLLFYEENLFLQYKLNFLYKKLKNPPARHTEDAVIIREKFQKVYQSFSMESERRIYRAVIRYRPSLPPGPRQEEDSIEPGHIDLF